MTTISSTTVADLPQYLAGVGRACTFQIDAAVSATSDVTLTLPSEVTTIGGLVVPLRQFHLMGASVIYTANGTVGNRTLSVHLTDENADTLFHNNLSATIALITAAQTVTLALGATTKAQVSTKATEYMPTPMFLRAGSSMRVYDRATISTGDSPALTVWGLLF